MVEDRTLKVKLVYGPEIFELREVSRLVDRREHVDGDNVANFMGDLADMLADGEYYDLSPRDIRLLAHLYRAGVRPCDLLGRSIVALSSRQWGGFVGIRRKYLHARRDPSKLTAHLRATRATA